MNLYYDQFSEDYDLPRVNNPSKTLIIASTGRCGSHMLGHALHKTNSFGFPLEYTNPGNVTEWKRRLRKENLNELIKEIQQRRTSTNGVFGIKIHYSHISQFKGFHCLKETFPNAYFILLTRKDVLKQAVSLSIAKQTGQWINNQKPVNNDPQYNFKDIDHCIRKTIRENSSWKYILAANGCNFIEMDFDFVRFNLRDSIKKIATFMDVEINPETIPNQHVTKQQSSTINAEWEKKFLADYSGSELFSNSAFDFVDKVKTKFKRIIL